MSLEDLRNEAEASGYEVPEEPSGKDEIKDVAEPEVITYGDSE